MTITITAICATADCTDAATGKSKYCTPHKQAARAAFKAMLAAKDGEKEARVEGHQRLWDQAHAAGTAAAVAVVPQTMVVEQHAHPLDDSSPVVQRWVESEGPCGFAWVKVTPGTSSFARWLVKENRGRTAYQGGVQVRVGGFGQSVTRKESYADAFAAVLREAGVKAYAGSRLD